MDADDDWEKVSPGRESSCVTAATLWQEEMGGYVPPLPVLPGKPETRKQVKKTLGFSEGCSQPPHPHHLEMGQQSRGLKIAPRWCKRADGKDVSWTWLESRRAPGGSGAMWAAKPPAPAGACFSLDSPQGFFGLSFSHIYKMWMVLVRPSSLG